MKPTVENKTGSAPSAQSNRVWSITLGLVCLGILTYGYFYSENRGRDLPVLIGYCLPFGLVIWICFIVVIGRKGRRTHEGLSFLAIYGSLITSGLIGHSQQKRAETFLPAPQNIEPTAPVLGLDRLTGGAFVRHAQDIESSAPALDLGRLTDGMLVGRAQDDDIYDIAFPGDMLPNVDVIAATGKSAQLVYSIRIAENAPILMIKLVHYSQSGPLGVIQITATEGAEAEPAVHRFPKAMISRQSVSGGVIEFATLVPFVEPSAGKVLSVMRNSQACNVEVKGTAGFTTITPGITTRQHAEAMIALYHALQMQRSFVSQLQQNALSFVEFQQALLKTSKRANDTRND